jgi:hypothetical protein
MAPIIQNNTGYEANGYYYNCSPYQCKRKSYSQIVTLHQKNTTVEKVLKSIEKQTGYHFLYDKKDVSKSRWNKC